MKYIKLLILAILVQFTFTGCSYVSDYVEGEITKRASFSIEAQQVGSNVVITWSKTDLSAPDGFAGIEIYRTKYANDEYSGYVTIADKSGGAISGDLSSGSTTTCIVNVPASEVEPPTDGTTGIFFYRVGFIHWEDPQAERTPANGYSGSDDQTDYNNHTDIDEISGSARVDIN